MDFFASPATKRTRALFAIDQLTVSTRSICGTRNDDRTIGPESRFGKSVNEPRNDTRLRGGS